jgi:hypothetical protein
MKHEGFCDIPSCVQARLAAKLARLNAASGTDVLAADALLAENERLRALLKAACGYIERDQMGDEESYPLPEIRAALERAS